MPLTLDQFTINNLRDIVQALPSEVVSGKIELWNGTEFSFRWDDDEGYVVTWKEPHK